MMAPRAAKAEECEAADPGTQFADGADECECARTRELSGWDPEQGPGLGKWENGDATSWNSEDWRATAGLEGGGTPSLVVAFTSLRGQLEAYTTGNTLSLGLWREVEARDMTLGNHQLGKEAEAVELGRVTRGVSYNREAAWALATGHTNSGLMERAGPRQSRQKGCLWMKPAGKEKETQMRQAWWA